MKNMLNCLNNFDLSVIIPFYKKIKEFKIVIERNSKYLERNGIEVIIVLDEPSEQNEVLDCISNYYFINWKVIVNENTHNWRNPSKAINVGIKNSKKKYVLIISPESEFYGDTIYELRKYMDYYPNHFTVGDVIFADFNEEINVNNIQDYRTLTFGTLMVEREHLLKINGYNEELQIWGFDDVDIRARLNLLGIKKLRYDSAIIIHREFNKNIDSNNNRNIKKSLIPIKNKMQYNLPHSIISHSNWGNDFNKIIYDWEKNRYSYQQCKKYLEKFEDYYINDDYQTKSYKIIALVQSYNESKTINDFLKHLERFCDGIILLDDGSTDTSFSIAKSKKLLLKVKKYREYFNDLENRNILLNLGSFFSTEWFYFIDVDERICERYESVYDIIDKNNIDTVSFKLVHLWDNQDYYRKDYPYSEDGLQIKWRMFKNYGRMQIYSTTNLHFQPIPFWDKKYESNVLILHYGMLDKEKRKKKYSFYLKEDRKKIQSNYEHLISNNVALEHLDNLKLF